MSIGMIELVELQDMSERARVEAKRKMEVALENINEVDMIGARMRAGDACALLSAAIELDGIVENWRKLEK